jgi:FkbM family methyltransferase
MPRWIQAVSYISRAPEVWNCARRVQKWWLATRAYLQAGETEYPFDFHTSSGVRLRLDDFYELVTAWVVFCRDEYLVPKDARTILDLGANYGAFTLLAATAAPNANIVSVEPFPDTFEKLCRNIAANGLQDRVRCWPVAVADGTGTRGMSTAGEVSHKRTLLPVGENGGERCVLVNTVSLGEVLERVRTELQVDHIDLVKMDIEGDEHELLPDISPETLSKVSAWQMEYHPCASKEPLFAALRRAGLKCMRDRIIGPDCGVAYFQRETV